MHLEQKYKDFGKYNSLRGPTPFFTDSGQNYHFLFMGEKVSSSIWESCPKILGRYEYQNPPPK